MCPQQARRMRNLCRKCCHYSSLRRMCVSCAGQSIKATQALTLTLTEGNNERANTNTNMGSKEKWTVAPGPGTSGH